MSIADKKYKDLIEDIKKNGIWDTGENVRTTYVDGSPAYTKSVFGKQVVFEEGEIPLLTSKFVGWKTAFKELRLFWILQTVKKEDFEKENVKVWQEWFLEDGTLGKSYAYQFESRPKKEIVKVKSKILTHHGDIKDLPVINNSLESPNYNNDDYYIGKVIETDMCGEFVVLDIFSDKKEKIAKIQFKNTGSIRMIKRNRLTGGSIKETRDFFIRTKNDVGYLGNFLEVNGFSEEEIKILKQKWNSMISRCYSNKDYGYKKNYSDRNVFVDPRWHSFENFLRDVKYVPQFFLAKESGFKGWELDKDYYGSNCYSKETCVFLTKKENNFYTRHCKPFRITNKNEDVCEILLATTEAKDKYGLDTGDCSRYLNGKSKTKSIKGFHLEYIDDAEFLYRYKISSNQVNELINNIKKNPMSRRLMSSFWNDADVKEKALQECAMQTTWNVRDGKLDLLLYSRSVDTALGLPFNWIQYWFLLQLVAKASGLKAGRFIHQMGNVHYYCRHEDTLLKQIESDTYDQPKFEFTTDNNEFFNFTLDDINVSNYQNGGKCTYEVAI